MDNFLEIRLLLDKLNNYNGNYFTDHDIIYIKNILQQQYDNYTCEKCDNYMDDTDYGSCWCKLNENYANLNTICTNFEKAED